MNDAIMKLFSSCQNLSYLTAHPNAVIKSCTAKYRDTTLEKILKFSIECVSTTVSYEYRRCKWYHLPNNKFCIEEIE